MTDEIIIYRQIKATIEGKIYFFYHAFIYAAVNLILFVVNRLSFPRQNFHVWVLISWGLALYFHFITAIIFNPLNRKRWRQYLRKKGAEKSFIDFFYHLHIYIGVNVFLLLVNKLTNPVPWSIYPFFFWGLGLIIHLVLIKYLPRKKLLELRTIMKNNELFEAKIYLLIHFFIFLFFNLLFVVMNFVVDRDNHWFIYPLAGWGMGLIFHGVWIFLNKSHRIKRYKQKKGLALMKYYE
jgi:hypothetical protein